VEPELNTLGGDCNECRNLEKEVERLREENTKLKAEQVCHSDQCKLEEIKRLREALDKGAKNRV